MRSLSLIGTFASMMLTGCGARETARTDAGVLAAKSGTVTIDQGSTGTEIFASFRTLMVIKEEVRGCTAVVLGDCTARDCGSAIRGSVSETYQSAGTLAVKGPSIDVQLEAKADPLLQYGSSLSGLAQWAGGESLTVTTTGAEVPAFAGEAITAPSFVSLTAPSCPMSDCGTIPHDVPLLLRWSGGTNGTVSLRLNGSSDGEPGKSVTCNFAASAGTGAVPAEMLSTLSDLAPRYGSLSVSTHSSRVFNAGDYSVTLHAGTQGLVGKATF